jgi:adenosylcobinamide-phosphate synthase
MELATPLVTLVCALLLDRFLGEYDAPFHPVVWMGKLISWLLQWAPRSGWWCQFVFGLFLAAGLPSLSFAVALTALRLATAYAGMELVVGTFLLKASFALCELGAAADRVRAPVESGDLGRAREALRHLCSRDPAQLDAEALLVATVQSVAENLSDSYVAPLFYFLLFGVPGAIAYRAINTLDAMVGYRGRYEALGKASARLDDLANWVPARLTAALLLVVGWCTGRDVRAAWRIFRRDRAKTPSPNGGRPMAMMAGLLGVQLEKKGVYTLGDRVHPITPQTVRQAWRLAVLVGLVASGLCALGIVGIRLLWATGGFAFVSGWFR